jgi:hypothetical protein
MVPAAEWASVSGSLDRESWPTHMWFRLTQTGARAEEDDVEDDGISVGSDHHHHPFGDLGGEGTGTGVAGLTGSLVGEDDLVGPPGARILCNGGADCYFLKRGTCTFLHRAADVREAGLS